MTPILERPARSIESLGPRIRLYDQRFADDPHSVYRLMRENYGPLVPVELAPGVEATLVIDYMTANTILNDPEHFPADPRRWERAHLPAGCPLGPMMRSRPNALRTTGAAHARYRKANIAALAGVRANRVRDVVLGVGQQLITTFAQDGTADMVGDYARPLVFQVLNVLLGCPADIGERVGAAIAAMFESTDTAEVDHRIEQALSDLVTLKRREPGDDITTRLITGDGELTEAEVIQQIVTLYSALEAVTNLIANALLVVMTDDRFLNGVASTGAPIQDAIYQVLITDPAMANHCITYPRQPVTLGTVWLPADHPVVVSMAACNNDPALHAGHPHRGDWHLSWGSGEHACLPDARVIALEITRAALDLVIDALPEMTPVQQKQHWRPGPFHRALAELPVAFPPDPQLTFTP